MCVCVCVCACVLALEQYEGTHKYLWMLQFCDKVPAHSIGLHVILQWYLYIALIVVIGDAFQFLDSVYHNVYLNRMLLLFSAFFL